MAAKLFVFVAFLALARAGPAQQSTPSSVLQELITGATDFKTAFSEIINSTVNSEAAKNAQGAWQQGSESVQQQLTQLTSSLQAAANDATGKSREALNQAVTNLQRTTEELRRQHPEVEQQTAELSQKLQTAVQSAASETGRLAQELSRNIEATNQQLAPQIKKAFDEFTKHTQAVAKSVQDAAARQ